ncbi:hypothetical protein AB0L57_17885 [Nocardia sp. NPDC052254]|uniref:hypothetical protein n=1 Tax=Nocardia sp. NPDC052254 TaxID=3155681 RepID=UPI00341CA084
MTHAHPDEDTFGEFATELRALAEVLLERIEPTLRRAAADNREWDSCSWCPVCAAAALVRGEHHDVVAAVADHGTAIVTVLREALAGVPVEPLLPDDLAEPGSDTATSDGDHESRPDADRLREKNSRAGADPEATGRVRGEAAGRAGRGRHSATERPGYIPIPVRIKK